MKLISIVTPCYNEEANVGELVLQVREIFSELKNYDYEHIFIDNASTDNTIPILKNIAQSDKNVKIIINNQNFGSVKSFFYGLLQAKGDAVVLLVADFQDPLAMIKDFIREWENGWKIVVGVKSKTDEPFLMKYIRKAYYRFVSKISEINLIKDFMGYGLYDKEVMEVLSRMNDAYPYFRGLICETGFPIKQLHYTQKNRARGISKMNFYILYDVAMSGITSHSKVPIRLATMGGFLLSGLSLLFAFFFLVAKLLFWNKFALGQAPLLIGSFFFFSVQLFFIGILGEYVAAIHTQVLKRPLVIEKERINF